MKMPKFSAELALYVPTLPYQRYQMNSCSSGVAEVNIVPALVPLTCSLDGFLAQVGCDASCPAFKLALSLLGVTGAAEIDCQSFCTSVGDRATDRCIERGHGLFF